MKPTLIETPDKGEQVTRPYMGQWCILNGQAVKRRTSVEDRPDDQEVAWEYQDTEPVLGMYIGYRHVYSGLLYIEWTMPDYDSYQAFRQQESHEVWMFVTSDRKNPIRTFPDQVEWERKVSAKNAIEALHLLRDIVGIGNMSCRERMKHASRIIYDLIGYDGREKT